MADKFLEVGHAIVVYILTRRDDKNVNGNGVKECTESSRTGERRKIH